MSIDAPGSGPSSARIERVVLRCSAAVAASLLLAVADAGGASAQAQTDIFVATLRQEGRVVTIGAPVNLTRRFGAGDRPSFTPDGGSLVYTSIGSDRQAATWAVPLSGGDRARMTTPAVEGIDPTGDHVWVDARTVFEYLPGNPGMLRMIDTATGLTAVVARGVGPGLVKVPHHDAVNFVQIVPDSGQWLAEFTVSTKAVRRLGRLPPGAAYAAWTPRGALITAAGSIIYRWNDGTWAVAADLAAAGVRNISRVIINPAGDRLAFVAEHFP